MDAMVKDEDATAWVRLPRGVFKELPLHYRGGRAFIPHGGGFLRLGPRWGDMIETSNPSVKVIETSVPDDVLDGWMKG